MAFTSVNAQSSVNCASFWPGVTPGTQNTIDAPCFIYPWSPELIGTVNVTLAYDEIWRNDATSLKNLDHLEGVIQEALIASINTYEGLMDNIADVVVILGKESDPTAAADTSRPLLTTGACQIRLFYSWFGPDSNDDERLQMFAHEMYHCVQESMFGSLPDPSPWWVEGSANYFSNVVYPSVNGEWRYERTYHPDIVLYANDLYSTYSTSIFFQSMEPSKRPVGVNNWIRNQGALSADPLAERTRLSGLPDFVDDFHLFAKQFSLGKVMDSDGINYVPIDNPVQPHAVTLTSGVPLTDSIVGVTTLSAPPFTVQVFAFSVGGGQTVTISYSSNTLSNVLISYKLDGDTAWTTLPNAAVTSTEGTIVLPCNDGNPVTITILFTSTDDVDVADADITITQVSEDDTCECQQSGPNKRGLDRCPN